MLMSSFGCHTSLEKPLRESVKSPLIELLLHQSTPAASAPVGTCFLSVPNLAVWFPYQLNSISAFWFLSISQACRFHLFSKCSLGFVWQIQLLKYTILPLMAVLNHHQDVPHHHQADPHHCQDVLHHHQAVPHHHHVAAALTQEWRLPANRKWRF